MHTIFQLLCLDTLCTLALILTNWMLFPYYEWEKWGSELKSTFSTVTKLISNSWDFYSKPMCSLYRVSPEVSHLAFFHFYLLTCDTLANNSKIVQIVMMLLKLWFLYSCLEACENTDFKTTRPEFLSPAWGPGLLFILTRCP